MRALVFGVGLALALLGAPRFAAADATHGAGERAAYLERALAALRATPPAELQQATDYAHVLNRSMAWYAARGVVLIVGLTVAMYLVVLFPARVLSLYETVARRLAPKLEERGRVAVASIIHGLSILRTPGRFAAVFGWTVAHWLCNALAFWIAFRAFDIAAPFSAALFLQGIVAIGVAAPQMPGFFGVFEYFGQVGLGLYGVPSDTAVAWAITYHALTYVPITLLGAWYFMRAGLSLGDLGGAQRTVTQADADSSSAAPVAPRS